MPGTPVIYGGRTQYATIGIASLIESHLPDGDVRRVTKRQTLADGDSLTFLFDHPSDAATDLVLIGPGAEGEASGEVDAYWGADADAADRTNDLVIGNQRSDGTDAFSDTDAARVTSGALDTTGARKIAEYRFGSNNPPARAGGNVPGVTERQLCPGDTYALRITNNSGSEADYSAVWSTVEVAPETLG